MESTYNNTIIVLSLLYFSILCLSSILKMHLMIKAPITCTDVGNKAMIESVASNAVASLKSSLDLI